MQTWPAPSTVVNYVISLPDVLRSKDVAVDSFGHLQTVALNKTVVDRRLSLSTYIDREGFTLTGWFFGSLDEFSSVVSIAQRL